MTLYDLLPESRPPAEPPLAPELPETVHFFATVTVPTYGYASLVLVYGDDLAITPAIRAAAFDRNGGSWLDLVDKPDAQIERWGEVRFAPGPWPADMPRIKPGSLEERQVIEQAFRDAWATPGEVEQAEAVRAVRAKYGRPPKGNVTIMRLADSL